MTAQQVLDKLSTIRVVPVGVIENPDDAPRVAEALVEGGLGCFEVVFRTEKAAEAIGKMSKVPGILAGAGTVVTVDQVKEAVDNGATFVLSPGVDVDVVEYCVKNDICTFPGVATATDIQLCLKLGVTTMKFFPAEALGGLPYINAIGAPFPQVKFMPTGGVNTANLAAYLASPRIAACGGSWLAKTAMVKAGEFEKIADLAREAVTIASSVG